MRGQLIIGVLAGIAFWTFLKLLVVVVGLVLMRWAYRNYRAQ